jgi:hypothetical protein
MLRIGKFAFGVFVNKTGDYITYERAIGFRISWKERSFHDVYFYPKVHVHTCNW